MKYDLYPLIIGKLQDIYNIKSEDYLYKYLKSRTAIILNKKKITHMEMLIQALEDLNVEVSQGSLTEVSKVIYKEEVYTLSELDSEVMDNFKFRADLYGSIETKGIIDETFRKGAAKSIKFKGSKIHKKYVMFNRLSHLNQYFSVNPSYSPGIEGFFKSESHNDMKRIIEETLQAEIRSFKHGEFSNTSMITERQLEDYLVRNLDLIEDNLELIGRQVPVEGGIIDILAKDSKGSFCIIELKIAQDKHLPWQAIHYTKEIKERYEGNVRMITVSPEYSNHLYKALDSIGNVEILDYNIKVLSGKIKELYIKKAKSTEK